MNERILELLTNHGFIHEHMSPGERNDALVRYQKLTEVIVRDCANIDFRAKIGLSHESDYEVSRVIREHFGVEE